MDSVALTVLVACRLILDVLCDSRADPIQSCEILIRSAFNGRAGQIFVLELAEATDA